MRLFPVVASSDTRAVERLLDPRGARDLGLVRRVERIVADVRRRGDTAVRLYARRLDGDDGPYEVSRRQLAALAECVPREVRTALAVAADRIRRVAARQVPQSWAIQVAPGVRVEQRVAALARVGCYVPGGRYPLPSSLLMTAIPARVAGVREVVAVCPRPEPVVCAAAVEAGVARLFRLGGAHAVAALAYGTAAIPRVDKIVGPGSAWVAAAKAIVAPDCAVDFYAGPSEIVVVARRGRPEWIAADLVAQAEHDPEARAILLTPDRRLAEAVAREVAERAAAFPPARLALARRSGAVVTRSLDEAVALADRIAPEHLVCDDARVAARVRTAGTVFVGPFSVQAAGDYATGSNHVLPTAGAARARGGLSAADFVRVWTVQRLTREGLARLAPVVRTLARAEGLEAHAAAIEERMR